MGTGQNELAEYFLARYELRRCGPTAPRSGVPTTPKAPRVRLRPPGITGAAVTDSLRSSAVIALIVNERKEGIDHIYEKYLDTDATMEGKIVVRFTVAASGAVTACSVDSSTLGNAAMEREVCRLIVTWRFPYGDEGGVTFLYPFVFYSAGAK